jgi:hypothetical protein
MKYQINLGLQCDDLWIFTIRTHINVVFKIIAKFLTLVTVQPVQPTPEGALNLFCSPVRRQVMCIIPSTYRASTFVIRVLRCLVNAPFTFSGSRCCYGNLDKFGIYRRGTGVASHSAVATGWSSFRVRWRGHGENYADSGFLRVVRMSQAAVWRMSSSSWVLHCRGCSFTVK